MVKPLYHRVPTQALKNQNQSFYQFGLGAVNLQWDHNSRSWWVYASSGRRSQIGEILWSERHKNIKEARIAFDMAVRKVLEQKEQDSG